MGRLAAQSRQVNPQLKYVVILSASDKDAQQRAPRDGIGFGYSQMGKLVPENPPGTIKRK
jgi:hypothetical protein